MDSLSAKGTYYDGQTSGRHSATMMVDDALQVHFHGIAVDGCPLQEIVIPSRVGNGARLLKLPDGALFESNDNDVIDQMAELIKKPNPLLNPHFWESKVLFAVLALLITVGVTYGVITKGIPAASEVIAKSLPNEVSVALAEGTLEQLDKYYLKPTHLDEETQQHYLKLFEGVLPEEQGFQFRLNFRSSPLLGANAFALPNGDIIMTDELINIAENDEEVLAVLYHEIGHVVEHHSMRQLLAATGTAILFAWLLDDVEGIANLILTAPVLLIQSSYSRDHETEADGYALQSMLADKVDPIYFSTIMSKMSGQQAIAKNKDENSEGEAREDTEVQGDNKLENESVSEENEKSLWHYISTHPDTLSRIKRFEDASQQFNAR